MATISHQGKTLALHLCVDEIPQGLSFMTGDEEYMQMGTWRYPKGKVLAAHNHNPIPRQAERTQEMLVVLKGGVKAAIFSEDDEPVTELAVSAGEVLLLLAGGHGYEITEDDTVVIEAKNGPYPGAEADRRRL